MNSTRFTFLGEERGESAVGAAAAAGAGRAPAALTALTARGSSGCAAGSGPGTPLRAGWSWRSAAGAAGPPCRAEPSRAPLPARPGPPLPAPPAASGWGRAAAAPPPRPGHAGLRHLRRHFPAHPRGRRALPVPGNAAAGRTGGPARPPVQAGGERAAVGPTQPRARLTALGPGGAPGPGRCPRPVARARSGRGRGQREKLRGRAFPAPRSSRTLPALRAPG